MTLPERARGGIAALASVLAHALVLIVLAATTFRIASEPPSTIPLIIRNPAPPPPPPGPGGSGPPAPAADVIAPVEAPKPVDKPHPIQPPHPAERLKIAARPKPKEEISRQPTPAAAESPPEVVSAPAPAGGEAGSGIAGGVIGGVAGGQVGGKVGGRLGGTGDDVWSVDQVAVPPKVIDAVRPLYPVLARAHGQEGIVVVQAIIDRRGSVEPEAVQVIKSQPPFDDAALTAFRQWKFQPGRNDRGELVRVIVQQPIRFQLR